MHNHKLYKLNETYDCDPFIGNALLSLVVDGAQVFSLVESTQMSSPQEKTTVVEMKTRKFSIGKKHKEKVQSVAPSS